MPYPNFYPYQQPYFQPPMPDQLAQLRQGQYQQPMPPQGQQNSPIIWVQGEAAARSYMVAAGNTVMLMDSDANTFYLKSADNSGVPQPLRVFDYTERTSAPKTASADPEVEYVTRPEFDALAARLDALAAAPTPEKKAAQKKEDKE